MNETCHETRMSLGAYALGTLEPVELQQVENHLAGCPVCLAELDELQTVVPSLGTLSRNDVAPPNLPEHLFTRVVDAVDAVEAQRAEEIVEAQRGDALAAARRGRSRRWLVAVAASVVLLGGAGTGIGIALSSSNPASRVATASAPSGVSLRVAATSSGSSSTKLELTAKGLPLHEHCHLVAVAADGSRHDAGRWAADYDGSAMVTESTEVPFGKLRSFTLYGTDGNQLVSVPLG